MDIGSYFPIWDQLSSAQQERLGAAAFERSVSKGTVIHDGSGDCAGLLVVLDGQLRAYILSQEGREVTLYRLFPGDICLFSASCAMNGLELDLTVEAQKDTRLAVIPGELFQQAARDCAPLANYVSQLMASRFAQVTWLLQQILWQRQDKRLAAFLVEESAVEGNQTLSLTHDRIASHLGTAREVVTRILRYLQSEGLVQLTRGTIVLQDMEGLRRLADS